MKVLITGAAGFIGSNLVHYLNAQRSNWNIHALDLLTYAGNFENIADLVLQGKISFHKLDIADADKISTLFATEKFDLVFHLAAESHVDRSIHSAAEFIRTNVVGTQVLLDSALRSGKGRFVHISTDEVYGSLGPTGYFVESTPLDPTSPYAASKASSDLLVMAYSKTHALDAVITRCTNNYGPYQFPEKLIPLFITNALEGKHLPLYGDGLNVRSWIFVSDHCEALLKVAENGKPGQVYNVGGSSEAEVPNLEVTKRILKLLGKPESLIKKVADRKAHDLRYAIDYTKIYNELGWQPRTKFETGLEQTVNWYLKNRAWWEKIKSGEYQKFYELNYSSRA